MPSALITGINGQIGSYLAELLLDKGYIVYGIRKRDSNYLMPNIDHIKGIELIWGDLSNNGDLCRIINEVKPDELYNLAVGDKVTVFDASGRKLQSIVANSKQARIASKGFVIVAVQHPNGETETVK